MHSNRPMHTARTSLGTLIAAVVTASFGCGGSTQSEATGAPGPSSDGGTLDGSPANDASGGRDGGTRPGFTPVDCTKGSGLGALTAAPAFDYVELRQENGTPSSTTETVLDKVGTLCAKATDVPACKTKFAAIQHPYPIMCSVPYCSSPRYLAYTRGDEVASIEEGKSLAGLVAPIDSAAEALFVLGWTSPYGCAGSAYRASGDGFDVSYSYETECPNPGAGTRHDVVVHVGRDGTVTVLEDVTTPPPPSPVGCAAARRAADVHVVVPDSVDADAWLDGAARLEAASVGAFARLARELAAHGAPRALVARVASAARDERRHARLLRRASRARVTAKAPKTPRSVRPLIAVALENAVEGRTRETWGAVVAARQARVAAAHLRAPLAEIAADESRHAELAIDVAAWVETRLSAEERSEVEAARRAAVRDLAAEVSADNVGGDVIGDARATLGLPAPAAMRALFASAHAAGVFA